MAESLHDLQQQSDFIRRHIGPGPAARAEMLKALGYDSLDALIDAAVPKAIRSSEAIDRLAPMSETAALRKLRSLAEEIEVKTSLIGMGYSGCILPGVIQRNVLENPGWYTAYTPYQAEVSQGRLEALLNFQQMIMDLTGLDLANASLLDEATAAAEAMAMSRRLSPSQSEVFFVDSGCHPQTVAVLQTRAAPLGIELKIGDPNSEMQGGDFFGVLLQYPASDGGIPDLGKLIETAKNDCGALVTVAADILALVLLSPPGELGADIAVGSAQRFGVPMGYGGPHAAFFATRSEFKRSTPGRIIGVSEDSSGKPALRMALQTREQRIRREKATSNICTAQVLLAVIAGFYAVYHGPEGLKTIARRVHRSAAVLAAGLKSADWKLCHESFFDTLAVKTGKDTDKLFSAAAEQGFNLRRIDGETLGIALDETTGIATLETLWQVFGATGADLDRLDKATPEALPKTLRRESAFLTHEVFNAYRSETEMLRYLRRLEGKDIALNRAMIPLGSCTMKLNATAEMTPITWPEFSAVHPFAPEDQVKGYRKFLESLEADLRELTGFAGVSLQPNAGSQGEYSGLLTIRAYHADRGEAERDICLIPSSAHGTNPASAIMAGLEVVVVGCDEDGNIDLEDLQAKAEQHRDKLAALMVTYPSTHGVFETGIKDICKLVHDNGGQVYLDGANFNALVGLSKPAEFGADVMHLNLHKTFCIPHGGGGPGMGPIACAEHLAPFLPGHPVVACGGEKAFGTVSAAPWSSASILPISWVYIHAMGGEGLTEATKVAILNANYLAKRLGPHYPVLYTGQSGLVAHECIVDLRPLKEASGITVDDVAKRLIDYGFHAPTMSWPVAGTMMIEPTESEDLAELDRFCNAMIAIRAEVSRVESGEWDGKDNPLVNAPHTDQVLAGDAWTHPYSREEAAYPLPALRHDKYWPPVGRVDNVAGDRNLVCSCPPMEAYQAAAE
ncbi:MAG: aminomethyl-transferring glycine dehydrogenase [Rhodovibrionaceae bacterium]